MVTFFCNILLMEVKHNRYYKRNNIMHLGHEENLVNIGEGSFSWVKNLTGHLDIPI